MRENATCGVRTRNLDFRAPDHYASYKIRMPSKYITQFTNCPDGPSPTTACNFRGILGACAPAQWPLFSPANRRCQLPNFQSKLMPSEGGQNDAPPGPVRPGGPRGPPMGSLGPSFQVVPGVRPWAPRVRLSRWYLGSAHGPPGSAQGFRGNEQNEKNEKNEENEKNERNEK